MKKYLKTILLLGGIAGSAYGSNPIMSDENGAQIRGMRDSETTAQAICNLLQSTKYAPMLGAQVNPQQLYKMVLALISSQLLADKTKDGNAPRAVCNKFAVTNTTSGRSQARTTRSLLKESQQNCLGAVTDIQYDASAGSKQTVIMVPSTTRQAKQTAPRSPVSIIDFSWGDIVAEVEGKFMRSLFAA